MCQGDDAGYIKNCRHCGAEYDILALTGNCCPTCGKQDVNVGIEGVVNE